MLIVENIIKHKLMMFNYVAVVVRQKTKGLKMPKPNEETEEPFPCGECGRIVKATEKHTLEDCLEYKKKYEVR